MDIDQPSPALTAAESAALALLRVESGGAPRQLQLGDRPVVLGRSPDCDVILDDSRVSRKHARIERRGPGHWIVDLDSQNGTWRAGRRVRAVRLSQGDVITVGSARLVYDFPAAGESPPPATEPFAVGARAETARWEQMAALVAEINRDPCSPSLFKMLVDAAVELTGGERGFLILSDRAGMEFAAARGIAREELQRPEFEVSWSIAVRAGTRGEALLTVNAKEDPRFSRMASVEELGLRSVICVPVKGPSGIQGVIYVDHRAEVAAFEDTDVHLLEVFADQASVALTNRRLMDELKEKAAMVEDLNNRLKAQVRKQEETISTLRVSPGAASEDPYLDFRALVGESAAIRDLKAILKKVAQSEFTVLIQGESGTGKEIAARCIHRNSPRARSPFITINCAAMPEALLENELFGHVRGAFSGADRRRRGLIEAAHGGTLFLDEVSEMSPAMQSRLLRVVQDGVVRPVGSQEGLRVDARVVAASNRDLADLVEQGKFREDLFYRLRVLPVEIAPLRDRRSDIPLLARHFLERMGVCDPGPLPDDVLAIFMDYNWPGNVRELENEISRMVTLGEGIIRREHVSAAIVEARTPLARDDAEFPDLMKLVESVEVREINKALQLARGNKTQAAALLGITRFTLQRKLDKYGITAD